MESKWAELSSAQMRSTGRNLVFLKEAESLATALDERKIPALFLKGIALLDSAYENPASRTMIDIDLLVHAKDLEETVAVIRDAGYMARGNTLLLSKDVGEFPVQIDLHCDHWIFSTEQYWQRSRQKTPTSNIRVLCPEDEFLLCILHSVIQDGMVSSQALADCTAILKAHGATFSWERFGETATAEGWERPVALFLASLAVVCPIRIPSRLAEGTHMSSPHLDSPHLSRPPYLRMLRLQSHWSKRFGLILRLLFPSAHFLRMRYSWMPARLSFLLPALRPFFLLAEYVSGRWASIMR